ncbi:hypothetical protein TNCV_738821 [Trichonephila clavipes]|nr:hypothetical protein TNCV_738821 [Trichonephila clavipes]
MLLSVGQKYSLSFYLVYELLFKEDILCTPAELVFGTTIRLPEEMFDFSKPDDDVVNLFRNSSLTCTITFTLNHQNTMATTKLFIHPGLLEATHVFLSPRHVTLVQIFNPMMALSKSYKGR